MNDTWANLSWSGGGKRQLREESTEGRNKKAPRSVSLLWLATDSPHYTPASQPLFICKTLSHFHLWMPESKTIWLGAGEMAQLLKRIQVEFLATMSGGSCLPVPPALGDLISYSGFLRHLHTYAQTPTERCMCTHNQKVNLLRHLGAEIIARSACLVKHRILL